MSVQVTVQRPASVIDLRTYLLQSGSWQSKVKASAVHGGGTAELLSPPAATQVGNQLVIAACGCR